MAGEVRFSAGDRAIYSTDSSSYRQMPIGVVIPKTVEDVVAAVEVCRRHDVPGAPARRRHEPGRAVLQRGRGPRFSKYLNRLVDLDRERRLARVQPGLILDHLRDRGEAGSPRVTFGPTPSTHDHCTIGGMVGNNSCGNYSIMSEFYGAGPRMAHNVAELEVLTYDGLRIRVGPRRRTRSTGSRRPVAAQPTTRTSVTSGIDTQV